MRSRVARGSGFPNTKAAVEATQIRRLELRNLSQNQKNLVIFRAGTCAKIDQQIGGNTVPSGDITRVEIFASQDTISVSSNRRGYRFDRAARATGVPVRVGCGALNRLSFARRFDNHRTGDEPARVATPQIAFGRS